MLWDCVSQGDYFQATRGGGNGDYHVVVIAPGTVQEMADCTVKAFEIADKYRVVCMILGDMPKIGAWLR